jgi:NTP pyrophosphatase (non-canonical NTP hydrolase)
MPKSLEVMKAEVVEYVQAMGWNENPVSFAAAIALLHEEAAEAGHAWRDHGLEDATKYEFSDHGFKTRIDNPKPEGVASEFADVLIRLLDDDARFKTDMLEYAEENPDVFALDLGFLENINTLHGLIARVTVAVDTCYGDASSAMAAVLAFLFQLCRRYEIDIYAEYERKMRYNRTRPYRHGGRRA